VITQQIYFDLMKEKATAGSYENLQDLRQDFVTICENAFCYYKANSNGYAEAKSMLTEGLKLIQAEVPLKRLASSSPLPSKRICLKDLPLPGNLEVPALYDFSDCQVTGPMFEPAKDCLSIIIQKADIQPYIQTTSRISFYPVPLAVVYTDPKLCEAEICSVCCSFARTADCLICPVCDKAFHTFCADGIAPWKCRDCRVCEICKDTKDALTMLHCASCGRAYDKSCLWPEVRGLELQNWQCGHCFDCKRCSSKHYHAPGFTPSLEHFYADCSICYECSWVLEHKQYCPECNLPWSSPYAEDSVPSESLRCKHCEFYFHPECVGTADWKNVCRNCALSTMDFAQAEAATLSKVQDLMALISQINLYKTLCRDLIERRYDLPVSLAKELSNKFLAENAEFLTTCPDIKVSAR
jgi:hypothetical protein